MFKIKSLSLKAIIGLFLINTFSCEAMDKPYLFNETTKRFYFPDTSYNQDLDPDQVPKEFYYKGLDPNENFTRHSYSTYINKLKKLDTDLFKKAEEATIKAKKEEAEARNKAKLDRLTASTPTYQSTYAAPLLGSKADTAEAKSFKAQANLYNKQADSLQYNNLYTGAKDATMIIAQLIAPSLPPALSPIILASRQAFFKTFAEKEADKDTEKMKNAKNAFDLANIKETESRDLANLAATLNQWSSNTVSGKTTDEYRQSAQLIAQLNLNALKDLEKRQKETSCL